MRAPDEPAAPAQNADPQTDRPKFRRWIIVLAVVALLLIGGYFAGTSALNRYLASTGFRSKIGQKLGQELQANAGFTPLTWGGFSMHSDAFLAQAPPPRSLNELRARNIYARC